MREKDDNVTQSLGICRRLYKLFVSVIGPRALANVPPKEGSRHNDVLETKAEPSKATEPNGPSKEGSYHDDVPETKAKPSKATEPNGPFREGSYHNGVPETKAEPSKATEPNDSSRKGSHHNDGPETKVEPSKATEPTPTNDIKEKVKTKKNKLLPKEENGDMKISTEKRASNINDRSDAYIRSRKAAMKRSFTFGSKIF